MRGSRFLKWSSVVLVLATFVLVASVWAYHRGLKCPGDLEYRYNESLCAHTGVNPFHVWNQEVKVDGFVGFPRPDKENCRDVGLRRVVHAYPPWHMAYTWFYGNMQFPYVVALIYLFYGFVLSLLLKTFKRNSPAHDSDFYWTWCAFCMLHPIVSCLAWGNYGIICAGALLGMIIAVEKHEMLAGLLWGFMMIKPQLATLFFFPLLFQKKYITIVVAALTCILATLWPAYVYGESPLALIMQVPQIGAPYDTSIVFGKLIPRTLVPIAKGCWIAFCVGLCGYCSWIWRSAKNPIFRYAPVAFFFPLWMYSQLHDKVASWPFVILVGLLLPQMIAKRKICVFAVVYILASVLVGCFCGIWGTCCGLGIFSPTGIGWVYRVIDYAGAAINLAFGLYVLVKGPSYWFCESDTKTTSR